MKFKRLVEIFLSASVTEDVKMDYSTQKSEAETSTEKMASYDVALESLFQALKGKTITDEPNFMNETKGAATMASSVVSTFDDTTPSDSGVQMLDSETSSVMIESITSQNGFEFEEPKPADDQLIEELKPLTKSDVENSNVAEDPMNTSTCSTFDTENIVYRRRVKKQQTNSKTPKKRVSFHEDILKNTRTDNIHIEHGFITYKNGRKTVIPGAAGRYSWCSQGEVQDEELCSDKPDLPDRRVVYRNACSDVLDYGNTDVYEHSQSNRLNYDNSGVFEYGAGAGQNEAVLYKCSCSSSNSSLDSDETDKNSNTRSQYGQAKSSSCDCIGQNNANNNIIGDNCYFSEPNIDNLLDDAIPKSVWSKEKKPKSSCLKKTKRATNIIHEQDLSTKVKKFNVHDMNKLVDNSRMIFGSLKSIFTIPLPERGVPEGSEDVQSVCECIPENSSPMKPRPFLSKSLDGSKDKKKKYVHNVDEQLRRKDEAELYAPTRQNSDNDDKQLDKVENSPGTTTESTPQFRSKFIINCESTVFEHTGVSYTYDAAQDQTNSQSTLDETETDLGEKATPIAESETVKTTFMSAKQTFANIFKTLKETATSPTAKKDDDKQFPPPSSSLPDSIKNLAPAPYGKTKSDSKILEENETINQRKKSVSSEATDQQSVCSDLTTSIDCSSTSSWLKPRRTSSPTKQNLKQLVEKQHRHLASPLRKPRPGGMIGMPTSTRYDRERQSRMSPDLFNFGTGRDSSTLLSEEFDDILTITTDTDKNDSDIVIVDYPSSESPVSNNLLKPPKTSLINRFLRNVTQKKILESSIQKNDFFAGKIKNEKKLFSGNLYVKGVKPKNPDLIEDLNAEIAMEIEMSAANSPRRELIGMEAGLPGDMSRFELGIGEISIDIFNGNCLHILKDEREVLMKVFKLYTGYSLEGYMTPVLVFLTDKTLYVTDLVRNRLCNKFVLPYSELDVILMGPYGNTVLLSNSTRDMQQVLLAGGPYPADGLVANLELCARRGGSTLPAVGQLTLEHLAPLQAFVCQKSLLSKADNWVYYAVVNVPAGSLVTEKEPLGPHVKGFLMHRRVPEKGGSGKEAWHAGYFLLKAGVLYMFNDSTQKLPTVAMALAECQGARRAIKTGRPHCFEIMLKHEMLQLAAPDEYVASEWLQALVQSASGLFELQERHKTLGCTLVMTENNLITLREDFTAPLRKMNKNPDNKTPHELMNFSPMKDLPDLSTFETSSVISSAVSTPTRNTYRSNSSIHSTPTQGSRSVTNNQLMFLDNETSYSSMSSVYGKNAGVEVLTCGAIKEMTGIRIPSHNESWWCILEFSCQEVRESSDDLVVFFASSSEMQRFLRMLEQLWQAKNNDLFPITVLDEEDSLSEQCTNLYMDINRSWEPLLSAALGYPL